MKNVIIVTVLFLCLKQGYSQGKLEIGASLSLVKFSNSNATIIGDRYLFQVPSLNATYEFSERLSLGLEWTFNTIKDIGLIKNSVAYNSYGGHIRYKLKSKWRILNPYILIGGTFVKSENYTIPTLNFGVGNTYWITDNIGVNSQFVYKFSENRFQSIRPHFQFTTGIVYRFDFNIFSIGRNRLWEMNH